MGPMMAAVLAAALAVATPGTLEAAKDAGPASAPRAPWPKELATRGAVLPGGMIEVVVPLGVALTSDRVGQPVFVAPGVSYGLTDDLTLGFRHVLGLCFNGASYGCPQPYNDLGVEATWRLWRWRGAEIAVGGAVTAAPIDPLTLSAEARLQARWIGGPLAVVLAPSLGFGLTRRDERIGGRRVPISFPLGSYSFGWFQDVTGNREILTVPFVVQVQVVPTLAVAAGVELIAPVDPLDGGPSDYATFPFGAAVIVTPTGALDVGVSFTFRSLFGREKWPDTRPGESRLGQLFVAFRI